MRQAIFNIDKPGLLTSFQDNGRYGFQRYGVVTSGAMDRFAFQLANVLVGNPLHSASMEICMVGPTLTFLSPVTFSICGANLSPSLNGVSINGWRTYNADSGDNLTFGKQVEGNYAYLAVRGGFDIEEVMGSRSAYSKAGIGFTVGKGTTIFGADPSLLRYNRGLNESQIPDYKSDCKTRYIPGPHLTYLQKDALNRFERQRYTYKSGDRMGYRFSGEHAIEHSVSDTLPSDPIPFGGIQIPPDGNPIILLADRQTTGGYPRIGTVISTDLPKVVQLPLGGKVLFKPITIEESQVLLRNIGRQFSLWSHC